MLKSGLWGEWSVHDTLFICWKFEMNTINLQAGNQEICSLNARAAAAAAAKSLQSCPTLSDPMDCSLPGSSIHGIFQVRVLEWGAIAFSTMQEAWGLIPGQGTRSHMLQLRVCVPHQRLKVLWAATNTQGSRLKKIFFNGLEKLDFFFPRRERKVS